MAPAEPVASTTPMASEAPAASVAVGQFAPTEDTSENLARIERFASRAALAGNSVLVLPEYSSFTPPRLDERIIENAESLDGPFATAIRELAREHSIGIVVGMIERASGRSRARNTLLLVDTEGQLVATYRKLHLYDALGLRESDWIEPGEPAEAPMMEIDGIRIGAQTCYDLRFPETSRILTDAGADVLVVAAQWVPGPMKEQHWEALLRARAIENELYVVAAGQSAPGGCGASMIIDPMGTVVAGMGTRVGVGSAEIDRAHIDQVRTANPVMAARRFRVVPGDPR